MILHKGKNIWDEWDRTQELVMVISTNSYVRKDGELVMGRGIAKEAKNRFPVLPGAAGRYIIETCGHMGEYNFILSNIRIGMLQVKYHFKDKADLHLIERGLIAMEERLAKVPRIIMNFPGIGYGGLEYPACLKLVEQLPDKYEVYQF